MDTAIEATSLSTVTNIAARPPLQLSTPSDVPRTPLVLYIARVPGSRDVFMTPLKPREKVVTAEDVQSSLYYVHVNSSADLDISSATPSLERGQDKNPARAETSGAVQQPSWDGQDEAPPALPRRPTPGLMLQSESQAHIPKRISRKPVLSDVTNTTAVGNQDLSLPALPPRPLPPNPPNLPPRLPPRKQDDPTLEALEGRARDSFDLKAPRPSSLQSSASNSEFSHLDSLTLIRRDPASADQWNVARIYDPPMPEVSSATSADPSIARRTKKSGTPLYLDITNPSYVQFALPEDRPNAHALGMSDPEVCPSELMFRRRLFMPGSRYTRHDYASSTGSTRLRDPRDACAEDTSMYNTMREDLNIRRPHSTIKNTPTILDHRSKYYSFTSPWGSLCEFSTGTAGRSLKCKHHVFSAQLFGHKSGSMNNIVAVEVSELRFNLPTPLRKNQNKLPKRSSENEKRSSYLQGFQRQSRSDLDAWDDDDVPAYMIDEQGHVDLTLGQEKAGGGFGGKQAKLGKLIVQPEGLKMLDLLVAANVGLWWRAYEQVL